MPFDVFGTPGENVKREGIHTDDLAAPFSSVQKHACARVYTASHRRPRPLSDGRWYRGFTRMAPRGPRQHKWRRRPRPRP